MYVKVRFINLNFCFHELPLPPFASPAMRFEKYTGISITFPSFFALNKKYKSREKSSGASSLI
jgi:hypothetical protein